MRRLCFVIVGSLRHQAVPPRIEFAELPEQRVRAVTSGTELFT